MLELGVLTLFILQEEASTGIGVEPMCSPEFHIKIILLNDALIDTRQNGKVDDSTK